MSDSSGWIHDRAGIKLDIIKEIKEVKRGRISEYADRVKGVEYHEGRGVWSVDCDIALPCATQNELLYEDAEQLVANGCRIVAEGANMPTTMDATEYFMHNKVTFFPGKASNAGGVATSGLEMSQNSGRINWEFNEVDLRLQTIMKNIYRDISRAAAEYDQPENFILGANIAGFRKVADAMLAQGIV
jgi:glutamate dehydrogenase (NADP+)